MTSDVVVHGKDVFLKSALVHIFGALEDDVQRVTALFVGEIVALLAPPGIDQVIEAGAVDVLRFDEIEDAVEVLVIVAGQFKAQAYPLLYCLAVAETFHGLVEGAHLAAEFVVDLADAVEADAHVGEAEILDALRDIAGDKRAVGGQRRADSQLDSMLDQLKEVLAHERLAAGEQ
jgi:hypothetical protein